MLEVVSFAAAPTAEDRTISGLLVPWDTPASDRPLQFGRGSLKPPAGLPLRLMHDKGTEPPVATMALEDTADGLVLTAEVLRTTRGDDALELINAGVVRGLSPEVAIYERDRTTTPPTVTRAELVAGALVPAGAFTDAKLFARQAAAAARRRRWRTVAALG